MGDERDKESKGCVGQRWKKVGKMQKEMERGGRKRKKERDLKT